MSELDEMRGKIQAVLLQYLGAIHAELIHSHDDVFLMDKILSLETDTCKIVVINKQTGEILCQS